MIDNIGEAANERAPSPVVTRRCPSCKQEIKSLQLAAFSLPIEQHTVPWLRMMNRIAGWSLRFFGQTNMQEPQFLCFVNFCLNCTHISWWDVGTQELEYLLTTPGATPALGWVSNPDHLREMMNRLPVESRRHMEKLVEELAPKSS